MRTFTLLFSILVAGALSVTGCSSNIESVSATECASTQKWVGDESADPEMHPGKACIACHSSGEGPRFAIAGTVYGVDKQADDCLGSDGAIVQITEANGTVHDLATNAAGNFYLKGSITTPYTAKVLWNGKTHAMGTPQTNGDCNSCHTQGGANAAPGRVILPQN
jgi:hypothetical protein